MPSITVLNKSGSTIHVAVFVDASDNDGAYWPIDDEPPT